MKDQAKELLLIISSVMNVECNLSKDNLQVHKIRLIHAEEKRRKRLKHLVIFPSSQFPKGKSDSTCMNFTLSGVKPAVLQNVPASRILLSTPLLVKEIESIKELEYGYG